MGSMGWEDQLTKADLKFQTDRGLEGWVGSTGGDKGW